MRTLFHLALTQLILGVAATAQIPASVELYGTGCNGGPLATCLTQNDVSPTLNVASMPNEYGYGVSNTTGLPIQVVGFEVFTVTNSAPTATGNTGVLRDDSGAGATTHTQPAFTAEATGKITVTSTQGWYSTTVYPPVTIQAGEAFWISVDAFSAIAPPQAVGGVSGPATVYWRRPNYLNNAWAVSGSVSRPIFRIHCLPASPTVPTLTAVGLPQIGQSFTLQVSGGTAFLPAFVTWSFDNTQWLTFQTPVDLSMFGAPNCFAQTGNDVVSLVMLDPVGVGATPPVNVPNVPGLAGVTWYNQAATVTPGVNAINLLVTNAATVIVGN